MTTEVMKEPAAADESQLDGATDQRRERTTTDPPAMPSTTRPVAGQKRFKLFNIDEVLQLPSPEWRVEGLLPVGALSMIYAPQAQFKSFFALDLALSVAQGIPFHGRNVKQGPIVYILGEGCGSLKNRLNAWLKEHPVAAPDDAFFVLEAVQFGLETDVAVLRKQIAALQIQPAMLFIDTFARSAVGLDENDAMQVGKWIDAVTKLQHATGIDVVAIHHAQKSRDNGKARERGSSAFVGAVDTVIRLERKQMGKTVTITCEKQKDAEEFKPFTLVAKVVDLGLNTHGDRSESCVLVDLGAPTTLVPAVDDHRLTSQESVALEVLANHGALKSGDWRAKIISKQGGKDIPERTFQRWRQSLVESGLIEEVAASPHVYQVTEEGKFVASRANGAPSMTDGDPSLPASHATPPKGVAGGARALADEQNSPGINGRGQRKRRNCPQCDDGLDEPTACRNKSVDEGQQ